jgi:hypothetical protein
MKLTHRVVIKRTNMVLDPTTATYRPGMNARVALRAAAVLLSGASKVREELALFTNHRKMRPSQGASRVGSYTHVPAWIVIARGSCTKVFRASNRGECLAYIVIDAQTGRFLIEVVTRGPHP